jgi:hypothetical protein
MLGTFESIVFIEYDVGTDCISWKAKKAHSDGEVQKIYFFQYIMGLQTKHFIYVCNNAISPNNLKTTTLKYSFACLTHFYIPGETKD